MIASCKKVLILESDDNYEEYDMNFWVDLELKHNLTASGEIVAIHDSSIILRENNKDIEVKFSEIEGWF